MFCKIYWDLYWDLEGMSDFFQIIYKFLTALCNCGFFLGFLRFFYICIYIYEMLKIFLMILVGSIRFVELVYLCVVFTLQCVSQS